MKLHPCLLFSFLMHSCSLLCPLSFEFLCTLSIWVLCSFKLLRFSDSALVFYIRALATSNHFQVLHCSDLFSVLYIVITTQFHLCYRSFKCWLGQICHFGVLKLTWKSISVSNSVTIGSFKVFFYTYISLRQITSLTPLNKNTLSKLAFYWSYPNCLCACVVLWM